MWWMFKISTNSLSRNGVSYHRLPFSKHNKSAHFPSDNSYQVQPTGAVKPNALKAQQVLQNSSFTTIHNSLSRSLLLIPTIQRTALQSAAQRAWTPNSTWHFAKDPHNDIFLFFYPTSIHRYSFLHIPAYLLGYASIIFNGNLKKLFPCRKSWGNIARRIS